MDFGIFNDEGLLEGDFATSEEAVNALAQRYAEDDAHVAECCHDHPEQEAATCETCNADEDEGETEVDE